MFNINYHFLALGQQLGLKFACFVFSSTCYCYLLLPIWIDDREFSVFFTRQVPVTHNDDVLTGFGKEWEGCRIRGDSGSRSLQFLKKFTTIFARIGSTFRTSTRIHSCQLPVQDKPVFRQIKNKLKLTFVDPYVALSSFHWQLYNVYFLGAHRARC